jgi:hypothetical protein
MLALPSPSMRRMAIPFAIFFAIFAAVLWGAVADLFDHSVDDVFDLSFLLFQAFWALGWLVGVLILGALTILLAFYSESARIEDGRLIHIPQFGPLKILVDYDLAKVRNARLDLVGGTDSNIAQVRFDYDGGVNALGNAMGRAEGQRVVDAIAAASLFVPRAVDAGHPELRTFAPPARAKPAPRTKPPAEPLPLASESAIALVVANLIPLVGVLFFGWDLGSIMVLYWAESGVIAFYTVLKIAIVGKLVALVAAPFFVGHFGGFMAAHFLLIYALFLRKSSGEWAPDAGGELHTIFIPIWVSIAALFISHGVSFFTNFIGQREYEAARVSDLMHAPYIRVIVMHLTLILGGWIVMLIGMPAGALVVLLLLKTAVDLLAHRHEHAAIGRRSG